MSLSAINAAFYKTTAVLQRRTVTADSIGDLVETWTALASGIPITIQPDKTQRTGKELDMLPQGKEFLANYKAYMPTTIIVVKNGDRIVADSLTYDIEEVEVYSSARASVTTGHHYKLKMTICPTDKS